MDFRQKPSVILIELPKPTRIIITAADLDNATDKDVIYTGLHLSWHPWADDLSDFFAVKVRSRIVLRLYNSKLQGFTALSEKILTSRQLRRLKSTSDLTGSLINADENTILHRGRRMNQKDFNLLYKDPSILISKQVHEHISFHL